MAKARDKLSDLLEDTTVPAVFELGSFGFRRMRAETPFVHLAEEHFAVVEGL